MNEVEFRNALRRSADALPPAELGGPALRAASRIRRRRRIGAVAAVAAGVVVVVLGAALGAGLVRTAGRAPAPAAPTPVPTPTGPAHVDLAGLPTGPVPPLDRVDSGYRFHGADGRAFTLADPGTLDHLGPPFVEGAHLFALRSTAHSYAVSVDGGAPVTVVSQVRFEDFRFLLPGPGGSAFVEKAPGLLAVFGSDGRMRLLPTAGRTDVAATRTAWWGSWHQALWRLNARDPHARWVRIAAGGGPYGTAQPRDLLWAGGGRCTVLYDGVTARPVRRQCSGDTPVLASPDSRYAVTAAGSSVRILGLRTGSPVLVLKAPAGQVPDTQVSAWSGSRLVFGLAERKRPFHQVGWVSCDVPTARCTRVELPPDTIWLGSAGR